MSEETLKESTWKTIASKIWVGFLKCFRGLVAEKKDGEWELSKGNTAFWLFSYFMLRIWDKIGTIQPLKTDLSMMDNIKELTSTTDAVEPALTELTRVVITHVDVPEMLFYSWLALLTYAGVKKTQGGISNLIGVIKGK